MTQIDIFNSLSKVLYKPSKEKSKFNGFQLGYYVGSQPRQDIESELFVTQFPELKGCHAVKRHAYRKVISSTTDGGTTPRRFCNVMLFRKPKTREFPITLW